ncbi:DUF1640-domain-containing protein [Dipodascopsis tothii]|uniref:DUF1640-domain-containing protein n=1 Tax=Dipodascopsis tothii TaxID=44089 RepID=UPI0034CD9E52
MATGTVRFARSVVGRPGHLRAHSLARLSTPGAASVAMRARGLPDWRTMSTTAPKPRHEYYFDTLKFVRRLESEGFSNKQAEAVLQALSDVIDESVESLSETLVKKEFLSRQTYQQKVDFTKLRSELQTLDKAEFSQIRNDHDRLANEIEKLKQKLKEEVSKTQASVRLDMNLEKGRIREEGAIHELKIKETDTRIDSELSNVRTQLEAVKFQVLQWLVGVCTGTFAIVLAYIRLLM